MMIWGNVIICEIVFEGVESVVLINKISISNLSEKCFVCRKDLVNIERIVKLVNGKYN